MQKIFKSFENFEGISNVIKGLAISSGILKASKEVLTDLNNLEGFQKISKSLGYFWIAQGIFKSFEKYQGTLKDFKGFELTFKQFKGILKDFN